MNRLLRRTRLAAGAVLTDRTKSGSSRIPKGVSRAENGSPAGPPPEASRIKECTCVRIDEPVHFNWVRYEHLMRKMHGKVTLAAALISGLVLVFLGLRAGSGEYISPERWVCGAGSGWFIAWMLRLALFTVLAAPRFISFLPGGIHLSHLGVVRPNQVLHWHLEREVTLDSGEKACARLELCCRWLWWERRWAIFLTDATQAELLRHLLQTRLSSDAAVSQHTWSPQLRLKPES